jgi:hypothetical protein
MNMFESGDKDILIKISDFKILLEIKPLLKLSSFAETNKSVEPPPPIYSIGEE